MRNITSIMSVCMAFGLCGSASAEVKAFQPATGAWHVAGNWIPSGIPAGTDRVEIPTGKTCDIQANAIADTIVVASTAVLNIHPGYTLTLENDTEHSGFPDDSDIIGTVVLLVNNPPTAGGSIAFTAHEHHLLGDGAIRGQNPTLCKITIAAGIKVRNFLAGSGKGIRGSMTIEGLTGGTNGKFRNDGLVEADAKGTITLASTTILEDASGADWSIGDCYSSMVFNRESLGLLGDFFGYSGAGGQFVFNESIKTCGTYTRHCSNIDVGSGKTFSYVIFVDGAGSCGNPGSTSGADPPTCASPYVVSSDAGNHTCTS